MTAFAYRLQRFMIDKYRFDADLFGQPFFELRIKSVMNRAGLYIRRRVLREISDQGLGAQVITQAEAGCVSLGKPDDR